MRAQNLTRGLFCWCVMSGAEAEQCDCSQRCTARLQVWGINSSTAMVDSCWEKEGGKIKAWSERAVLV